MVNFMLEFRKRTLKRAKECPTIEMVGKGHVGLDVVAISLFLALL